MSLRQPVTAFFWFYLSYKKYLKHGATQQKQGIIFKKLFAAEFFGECDSDVILWFVGFLRVTQTVDFNKERESCGEIAG